MIPTFPENLEEEEEKDFIFWEQTQNWTLLERILEHYGLSHLGKFSKKNWNRREGEQRTGIGILYWLGEDSTSQSHTCGKVNSIFYKCLKVHKEHFSYV